MQVLQGSWDRTFSEHSHGFRPQCSAHQAVAKAQQYIAEGNRWVVDLDLEKFFDRVNHDKLMAAIARRGDDLRDGLPDLLRRQYRLPQLGRHDRARDPVGLPEGVVQRRGVGGGTVGVPGLSRDRVQREQRTWSAADPRRLDPAAGRDCLDACAIRPPRCRRSHRSRQSYPQKFQNRSTSFPSCSRPAATRHDGAAHPCRRVGDTGETTPTPGTAPAAPQSRGSGTQSTPGTLAEPQVRAMFDRIARGIRPYECRDDRGTAPLAGAAGPPT